MLPRNRTYLQSHPCVRMDENSFKEKNIHACVSNKVFMENLLKGVWLSVLFGFMFYFIDNEYFM